MDEAYMKQKFSKYLQNYSKDITDIVNFGMKHYRDIESVVSFELEFMLKKFDKHSIALGKSAEEAVQILWNETKPIILKYYDKKRNPSSRWHYKES